MTTTSAHRPMDRILAEWRQAESRLDEDSSNAALALVEQLRVEYTEALKARLAEAEELSRPPRLLLEF